MVMYQNLHTAGSIEVDPAIFCRITLRKALYGYTGFVTQFFSAFPHSAFKAHIG